MPLPSFLQRKTPPAARRGAPLDEAGEVQAARTRARRRLVGAVLLLAAGVVGFPMLFETQPRPLPADLAIVAPSAADAAAPLLPAPPQAETASNSSTGVVVAEPSTEPSESAPPPAATATPAPVEPEVQAPPTPAPVPQPALPAPTAAEGERARALLEGSAASAPAQRRFIVQVGAYGDAGKVREVRSRVEKLGLKTYTQVIDTEAGKRTRVRVGPFESRAEADATGGRLKAAGLPVAVLAL